MSKELEYLKEIQNELDKNPRDKWKAYWNGKCNAIRQVLTPPTFIPASAIITEKDGSKWVNLDNLIKIKSPTKDEIIKILTPHYENWYMDFVEIEIDETGVYAVVVDGLDGRSRFIIFKIIDELMETSVCGHLKLEHISLISKYFMEDLDNG